MSRTFTTLLTSHTGPQLVSIYNNSLDALLSTHLSTSTGAPSYAVDGTIYIEDQGTDGWKYWIVNGTNSYTLGEEIWNAWDGDRDFGLNQSKNFLVETVTSVPGDLSEGRLVNVDTGTPDDGALYFCDALGYRRVLTDKQGSEGGYYTRKVKLTPDTSILNLTGSSDVAWTTLDISALIPSLSSLATADQSSVVINVRLRDSGGRAVASFRKSGDTGDSGYKSITTVAAETSVYTYAQFEVFTAAGVIQYQLDASGASTADLQIMVESANIAS